MTTTDHIATKREEAHQDGGASAVAVQDLHKSFESQIVLNGIGLTVSRGETLAVLGRSEPARAYC